MSPSCGWQQEAIPFYFNPQLYKMEIIITAYLVAYLPTKTKEAT